MSIVKFNNQKIVKYSSKLIKRGLSLAISIEQSSTKSSDNINLLLDKAKKTYQLNEYEKVLFYTEKVIKIDSNNYLAWWYKSRVLWRLYSSEEALIAIDQAIKIKSDFDKAWLTKSAILLDLKKYNDALQSSNKAIEINPKYSDAWNNKGLALKYLGRYPEAELSFKKAIEINPDYHTGKSNLLSLYFNGINDIPIEHSHSRYK